MFRIGVVIAAGTLALACAPRPLRTPHVLDDIDGVLVSNLLSAESSAWPRVRGGRLAFDYTALVENARPEPATLELVWGQALIADAPAPFHIACRDHRQENRKLPQVELRPGARARIDCFIELSPADTQFVARGDHDLVIRIPFEVAGRRYGMHFSYRLQVGDAE